MRPNGHSAYPAMRNDAYVHGYHARENERLRDQARALVDLLHADTAYPAGSRVLEVGCGVGAQTVTLARRSPEARFTSIDVSAASLAEARRRTERAGLTNVEFRQADVFALPFDSEAFDHVFVCFLLEHLARPVAALEILERLLEPGGTITVIEGDHGSTYFHPDSAAARAAIECQVRIQREAGGNALIGRQVYPLLVEAGFDAVRVTVSAVANEAVLHVESAAPSLAARAIKRAFDIVVAAALLVVASPVLAVIAVLIKKEDGGPVFFRQQRVGRGDVEFGMLKFRTMCVDAEARLAAMQADNQRSGPLFKLARDPRVTRIGHVLRRTSLDELPQLLNVLTGDMSLVGPRPLPVRDVDRMHVRWHQRRFSVQPGITCLWQIRSRQPKFEDWIRADMEYIDNWSLALDLRILALTLPAVISGQGAS